MTETTYLNKYSEIQNKTGFKHSNTRAIETKNRHNDPRLTFFGAYMEYGRQGDWQFSLSIDEAKGLAEYLNEWAERNKEGVVHNNSLSYVSKGKLIKHEWK